MALPGTKRIAPQLTITGLSSMNSRAMWDSSNTSYSRPTYRQRRLSSWGCSHPPRIVQFFVVSNSSTALMFSVRMEVFEASGTVSKALIRLWLNSWRLGLSLMSKLLGVYASSDSLSYESENRLLFYLDTPTVSKPSSLRVFPGCAPLGL